MTAASFAIGELPACLPTIVYVVRNADGFVLYVGMTSSLGTRFTTHRKSSDWWADAAAVTVELCPDRASAAARESELIVLHDPPHNRSDEWREKQQMRKEREDAFVGLYLEGVTLNAICRRLDISYAIATTLAQRMRAEGRVDPRQRRRQPS